MAQQALCSLDQQPWERRREKGEVEDRCTVGTPLPAMVS